MLQKYQISVTGIDQENGYRIFTIMVTNPQTDAVYKIYMSDKDFLSLAFANPTKTPEHLATGEMHLWIERSGGDLPSNGFLLLMNGGRISSKDMNEITALLNSSKEYSDTVRTNVTIAAPLFEWAKAKAQKEGTSFSDLVSRGLIALKESDKEIEAWFREQGAYFRKKLGDFGSFEVIHYMPNNYTEFSTETLQTALQASSLRRTGWPIGAYLTGREQRPHPQDDGIKAEYHPKYHLLMDYWYAKNKGEFYFARNLDSDSSHGNVKPGTALFFDTQVWRVAEALEHCLAFYKNLNINSNERVKIKLSLYGLDNRTLGAWNPGRAMSLSRYLSGSDKATWETELTLHNLHDNLDEIIYEAIKKLLVMFDFFVPAKEVVFDILHREYRKSQM
jgi:hypothetical protein